MYSLCKQTNVFKKKQKKLISVLFPASTLTLTGGMGDFANSSGHLRLYQNGVRGRICTLYWDDNDAKVACRQLGYSGGLAYALSNSIVGPYLWSEINCVGTENTVFDCPRGNASCRSSSVYVGTGSSDAGVFCFNNEGEWCSALWWIHCFGF